MKVSSNDYHNAYSLIRTIHQYGYRSAFFAYWELFNINPVIKRKAAQSFNAARKAGSLGMGTDEGFRYVSAYCPDCGRMLMLGVEDDISAPPSVTEYGDLCCSRCARLAERYEDEEYEYEPEDYHYSDYL
jgi:hypothetical protein